MIGLEFKNIVYYLQKTVNTKDIINIYCLNKWARFY